MRDRCRLARLFYGLYLLAIMIVMVYIRLKGEGQSLDLLVGTMILVSTIWIVDEITELRRHIQVSNNLVKWIIDYYDRKESEKDVLKD